METGKIVTEAAPNGPWLNDREQRAWRGFLEAHAAVMRALARQLQRDTELSLGDYAVLVGLSEAAGGERRSHEIADAIGWEASRLSHHLGRMERRGLVRRHPCPQDRRGVTTSITEAGRVAIEAAAPLHVAEVRRVFVDRLDDAQLDALGDIAARLLGPGTSC